jgi:hypothetical protein
LDNRKGKGTPFMFTRSRTSICDWGSL